MEENVSGCFFLNTMYMDCTLAKNAHLHITQTAYIKYGGRRPAEFE